MSDLIEEIVAQRGDAFAALVDEAYRHRELVRALTEAREALGLSQTVVAARMGTSQSAVARLEGGDVDARLSTLARYAAALGRRIDWQVVAG